MLKELKSLYSQLTSVDLAICDQSSRSIGRGLDRLRKQRSDLLQKISHALEFLCVFPLTVEEMQEIASWNDIALSRQKQLLNLVTSLTSDCRMLLFKTAQIQVHQNSPYSQNLSGKRRITL